jgi:hypothetical protein
LSNSGRTKSDEKAHEFKQKSLLMFVDDDYNLGISVAGVDLHFDRLRFAAVDGSG